MRRKVREPQIRGPIDGGSQKYCFVGSLCLCGLLGSEQMDTLLVIEILCDAVYTMLPVFGIQRHAGFCH